MPSFIVCRGMKAFSFPVLVSCPKPVPVHRKDQRMHSTLRSKSSITSRRYSAISPFVSILAIAGSTSAAAQENPGATTTRLPEVVVSATRQPAPIEETAASVTVITSREIEERKLTTLAGVLANVPGLAVMPSGTTGQLTSVFSRGTKSNHILLVVDGRRQQPNLAGSFDFANLNLDNVERVEVVRTPSSAMFGGDAIGGVINIITKSGRGLKTPEFSALAEGGSFGTHRETAGARGAYGKLDYSVEASRFDTQNQRVNNQYSFTDVNGSLGYSLATNLYADLKASYNNSFAGVPGIISFPTPTDKLIRDVYTVSPGLTWDATSRWTLKSFYSYNKEDQHSDTAFSNVRLRIEGHEEEVQNLVEIFENWNVTLGMVFQQRHVSEVPVGAPEDIRANQNNYAGYAESQWSPWPRLHLINSVRVDENSVFGRDVSWKQGVSWKIPAIETTVFGSVSRSFATPTFQDLYFPGFNNPNLMTEHSFSWEAGLTREFEELHLTPTLTLFHNDIDNLIQFVFPTPVNIARAETYGVEASLAWKPGKRWDITGNYTYLDARDAGTGVRLVRRPRHQAGADVTWRPLTKWTLGAGLTWLMNRDDIDAFTFTQVRQPDYYTVRAVVDYQVCKNARIWVRVENLTNQKYEPVNGFPALGRGFFGGVKITF
jgi:vitamin B12 transporter